MTRASPRLEPIVEEKPEPEIASCDEESRPGLESKDKPTLEGVAEDRAVTKESPTSASEETWEDRTRRKWVAQARLFLEQRQVYVTTNDEVQTEITNLRNRRKAFKQMARDDEERMRTAKRQDTWKSTLSDNRSENQMKSDLLKQLDIARKRHALQLAQAEVRLLRYRLSLHDDQADGESKPGADEWLVLPKLEELEANVLDLRHGTAVRAKDTNLSRELDFHSRHQAEAVKAKATEFLGAIRSGSSSRDDAAEQLHQGVQEVVRKSEVLLREVSRAQDDAWSTKDELDKALDQWVEDKNPECTSEGKRINSEDVAVPKGFSVTTELGPRAVFLNMSRSDVDKLMKAEDERTSAVMDQARVEECRLCPQTSRNDKAGPRYQSMTAALSIGSCEQKHRLQAIVDSGAAWSSISLAVLKAKYPELVSQIRSDESIRFSDASGRRMPTTGSVWMNICVGDHCFWTRVYVFEKLGVDFLLGVNALCDGDLVIRSRQGELLAAERPDQREPMRCSRPSPTCCTVREHAEECVACARQGAGHVVVDRRNCSLRIGGEAVTCERVETTEPMEECALSSDLIEMRAASDVIIVGKNSAEQQQPNVTMIPLEFQRWISGPEVGVYIEPAEFLHQNGLESTAFRHSSMNGTVHLKVSKHVTGNELIRKGTVVGYGRPNTEIEDEQDIGACGSERLLLAAEFEDDNDIVALSKKPYAEGGPPVTDEDYKDLGLDLSGCINPFHRLGNGQYAPLEGRWRERIKQLGTRWWLAWSRDTRAPRISRLVLIDIPTGDAEPIAQRPYPIPARYHDAVKKEIQKLLSAGLIEPGHGNWASPALLTVKKDSTSSSGDGLKIKIVVDYRQVNACSRKDEGGLGNQDEILRALGGTQKAMGIGDLAGGYYQCALRDENARERSAFILPSSMGGTLYQWRICPYGVTRAPASYSRGVHFALQWMDDLRLAPLGASRGGVHSWLDDVIFHADSMEGFMDVFERVLRRLVYCGLTLKASKTELLQSAMEVLGYLATPEGLKANPKKVEAIDRIPYPVNSSEVLSFLGAVNFYRRFLPRMGLLAKPLTEMLRKNGRVDPEGVRQSVDAIKHYLKSEGVLASPDFRDPNAEFVLCTDASDVAIGAVLMQWQWHHAGPSPSPPTSVKKRSGGEDPLNNSWRLKAGYTLKTIRFYSKTLDETQARYNVFDKEGGAILMAVREFADEITGYPTTVYTDSAVAASMLTKHKGTTRLQRWGLELMQYLPYLKVGFRAGNLNGCADLLSRFPYFEKYIPNQDHVVKLPEDLFEQVASAQFDLDAVDRVKLDLTVCKTTGGTYVLPKLKMQGRAYQLCELRQGQELDRIWQEGVTSQVYSVIEREGPDDLPFGAMLASVAMSTQADRFFDEQQNYEVQQRVWDKYVQTFVATKNRAPIVYDLYCGEGGFSRGARAAGFKCYGFDNNDAFRRGYETDPSVTSRGHSNRVDSGMTFTHADVDSSEFWAELEDRGRYKDLPPPDVIHASPPCSCHSKLTRLDKKPTTPELAERRKRLQRTIEHLQALEGVVGRPLVWQVENVPESLQDVTLDVNHVLLCGTMMGHRVFRERLFYCNYAAEVQLERDHKGKFVGDRGINLGRLNNRRVSAEAQEPNMYGVYSRRQEGRGTYDEWHGALGHLPGTFSRAGVSGALPLGYGRYLGAQMVAHLLNREYGVPVYSPQLVGDQQLKYLSTWSTEGYHQTRLCVTKTEEVAVLTLVRTRGVTADTTGPEDSEVPVLREAAQGVHIDDDSLEPEGSTLREIAHGVRVGDTAFEFEPEHQRQDPTLQRIYREVGHPDSQWRVNYAIRDDYVYFVDTDDTGEERHRLCVPKHLQRELMHHYHFGMIAGHRGGKTLSPTLENCYYWDGMLADCTHFAMHCRHCAERAVGVTPDKLPLGEPPVGDAPFRQIHIDLKGPLRKSGGNVYILVVVDSFTRYTLYIPIEDKKADTVFRALFNNVFCQYGMPFGMRVVSDCGTEFQNELQTEMGRYLGYRKIAVSPWNPRANGMAEAAVKRIKLLLDRHTNSYRDWHKLLPMAQYLLNTNRHSGIGMAPFTALYGRVAPQVPELENPELRRDLKLSPYAQSLAERLEKVHAQIKEESDRLRLVHRLKSQQSVTHLKEPHAVGDTVWMVYYNWEKAAMIRKSGQGNPWRHSYKIVAIKDYTVKLKALDGAPEVASWQPLHKVSKSPPLFVDDEFKVLVDAAGRTLAPGAPLPPLTYVPQLNPLDDPEVDGAPPDQDGNYEVEDVLSAVKRGNAWHVLVKWKGWRRPTEERRTVILANSGKDVKRMVERACASVRLGNRATIVGELNNDDDSDSEPEAEEEDEAATTGRLLQATFAVTVLDGDDLAALRCLLPASVIARPGEGNESVTLNRVGCELMPEKSERSFLKQAHRKLELVDAGGHRRPEVYALAVEQAAAGDGTLAYCLAGPSHPRTRTTGGRYPMAALECLASNTIESRRRWEQVPFSRRLHLLKLAGDKIDYMPRLPGELFGRERCPSASDYDGPPGSALGIQARWLSKLGSTKRAGQLVELADLHDRLDRLDEAETRELELPSHSLGNRVEERQMTTQAWRAAMHSAETTIKPGPHGLWVRAERSFAEDERITLDGVLVHGAAWLVDSESKWSVTDTLQKHHVACSLVGPVACVQAGCNECANVGFTLQQRVRFPGLGDRTGRVGLKAIRPLEAQEQLLAAYGLGFVGAKCLTCGVELAATFQGMGCVHDGEVPPGWIHGIRQSDAGPYSWYVRDGAEQVEWSYKAGGVIWDEHGERLEQWQRPRVTCDCCDAPLPPELYGRGRCPSCCDYDGPPVTARTARATERDTKRSQLLVNDMDKESERQQILGDDCPACGEPWHPTLHYECGHRKHACTLLVCCICNEGTESNRLLQLFPPNNRGRIRVQNQLLSVVKQLRTE